jgi:hypothetical protein
MRTSPSRRPSVPRLLAALLAVGLAPHLEARAIRDETFPIAAGWNLIHIGGDPVVKDVHQALALLDWESLWTWIPPRDGEATGRWVVARRDGPAFLDTLIGLVGETGYALRARSPGTLAVKAYVLPRRATLRRGTLQLFGPSVSATTPPTLAGYFSRPGIKESIQAVYELAAGAYRRVADGDVLRPGASYWVLPTQDVLSPDPLRVTVGLSGIGFDSTRTEAEIELDVGVAGAARPMTVRALPSADGQSTAVWLQLRDSSGALLPLGGGAGGGGGSPARAGAGPGGSPGAPGAQGEGAGDPIQLEVPPEESRVRIALAARAQGLAAPGTPDQGAVIEIDLPTGRVIVSAELDLPERRGIWIGEVTLDEVARPSFHGGGFAPTAPMRTAILLDIPDVGAPRLLPCIEVASQRDGKARAYRLQAALLSDALELLGTLSGDGQSGVLRGNLSLPPDHPLNPYRHRYHPEHSLGYDIIREIKLSFQSTSGEGEEDPLSPIGPLSGTYEETIRGLSREEIRVRGTFQFRRLDDGSATPCAAAQ